MMNEQVINYKQILDMTKDTIGKKRLLDLYIAMFVEMYLEERGFSSQDFDRICNYVKGIYKFNHDTIIEEIVYFVFMFVRSNPIEVLEDISYEEFIEEFLMGKMKQNLRN